MDKIIICENESVQEFVQRVVDHPIIQQQLQPFLKLPWFRPILLGWYPNHTITYEGAGPSYEQIRALYDAMEKYAGIWYQDFDLEDANTCVTHDWSHVPCRMTYRREGEILRRLVVRVNGVRGVVIFRCEPMILEKFPGPSPSF